MCAVRNMVVIGLLLAVLAAGCGGDGGDEGPTGEEVVSSASTAFADTESFHLVYDLSGQAYPTEFKSAAGTQHYLVSYTRKKE